jgi:hypothetical protein
LANQLAYCLARLGFGCDDAAGNLPLCNEMLGKAIIRGGIGCWQKAISKLCPVFSTTGKTTLH